MTLRQVEVHEIHAESDYDEDDEGPVAPGSQDGSLSQLLISRNRKEPFENLPRPSSHHSVLQTPASPLPPVPEFSARQVVAADVLSGLRWMLAPAAVAGRRLASSLRLLLHLLRPLHERLGAVPEVRLPPRRPGPACSGVARGRSTGAGHVRPRDAWAFNMAAYKSPLSQS